MEQTSSQANELLIARLKQAGLWQDDSRDPTSDLNAAHELEGRIEELRLQARYEQQLLDIIERDTGDKSTMFDVAHASAQQRCEAVLAALNADSTVLKKYLIPAPSDE